MIFLDRLFFFHIRKFLLEYPVASTLNYFWSMGILGATSLVIQLISGLLLSIHYEPSTEYSFLIADQIIRDINFGWLIRYIHANGASAFFILIYLHIFRGIVYGSFIKSRAYTWYIGVLILFLMVVTAFLGYVLPWGQMSFWGATVITNLVSAIPFIGEDLVIWIWGSFSVSNPTLNRFYSLHFIFPFVIAILVLIHIYVNHEVGSNNALTVNTLDNIPFSPFYGSKDLLSIFIFAQIFILVVFYNPDYLGHPDNFIEANPEVTPTHIVPEWYFLPFYAALRAVPNKLLGVLTLFSIFIELLILPIEDQRNIIKIKNLDELEQIFTQEEILELFESFELNFSKSSIFDNFFEGQEESSYLINNFNNLCFIGAMPAASPYVEMASLEIFLMDFTIAHSSLYFLFSTVLNIFNYSYNYIYYISKIFDQLYFSNMFALLSKLSKINIK